jgi:hypothetical protein
VAGGQLRFQSQGLQQRGFARTILSQKKVTGGVNSIDSSARNAGTVKGYFSRPVVFSETAARCKKIISR